MERIREKYVDPNSHLTQLKKDVSSGFNDKSLECVCRKYSEGIEKVESLCKRIEDVKTYLEVLESAKNVEKDLLEKAYDEMISYQIQK